jgi:malate permease and related proteins
MYAELLPVLAALALGQVWRLTRPAGIGAGELAHALNHLMIYVLGPALIFAVVLPAPLDRSAWVVPMAGVACALGGLALAAGAYGAVGRIVPLGRETRGAMLLAASFANGSIALPVVVALFGAPGIRVVYLHDLLATTVLIWTVGVAVAAHHAPDDARAPGGLWRTVVRLPPIWCLAAAFALNLAGIGAPERALRVLHFIGDPAVPLMVFTVGLALDVSALRRVGLALPALAIRHGAGPLLGLACARAAGLEGEALATLGVTMASACPAVGVILAHRFRLDTALYGAALALSLLSYLVLAPLYRAWLS